jgi:hypothetical protein
MSRFIVEYDPKRTKPGKKLIDQNISPAMENRNSPSYQYSIDYILSELSEELHARDIKQLKQLLKEGVEYIEIDWGF